MSDLDRALLAERVMTVERHLHRVAERLPASPADLLPATDASDAVVLHLWQATQIVIDLAMSATLALKLGTPSSYGDAFRRLQQHGVIDAALSDRLTRAAGFRNVVAHAYGTLGTRATVSTTYTFSKPGTYFPALRATSQRQPDGTPYARIQNLGRVRVVVK